MRKFDWGLLTAFGVLAVASLVGLAASDMTFFWRQLTWYIIAFPVMIAGSFIDWKWLGNRSWFRHGLYWFSVALLAVSFLQPGTIRGTKSWIVVGNFQFEPVELMKVALILLFAHFFSRRHIAAWQGKNILLSLLYAAIPIGVAFLHPDLGAALIIGALWVCFLLAGGINKKRFAAGVLLIIMMGVMGWFLALKPYQKDRLVSFVFPERDPLGVSYNVIQSKIAIGSAGWLGKGFGRGTQTQLHFLPEAHTDFFFAAFTEEWGILGSFALLLTFLFILFKLASIGSRARDNYSRLVIFGVGCLLSLHFFVNVGSNVGIMPVTGIPFPFLSYGGSSILTIAILISIIEHIKLESSR